jgi:hypothetical protein
MKKLILTAMIALFVMIHTSIAELDTLSYWTRGTVTNIQNAPNQFAAFYPEAPCIIKAIDIHFFGASGKATVVLLGSEGGAQVPLAFIGSQTKKYIRAWDVNVNASPTTTTIVRIPLDTTFLFAGKQFFVGVIGLSAGLFFATDQTTANPVCQSEDGGAYLYQSIYDPSNQSQPWTLSNFHKVQG